MEEQGRYDGYSIHVTEFEGNLFGETDGIDVHESASRYVDMLTERLETAYPGADVSITLQRGVEGARPEPSVGVPNDDWTETEGIAVNVREIEAELFQEGNWYVETQN